MAGQVEQLPGFELDGLLKGSPGSKATSSSKGRRYDQTYEKEPGAIKISDLLLAADMMAIAETDDMPGTLDSHAKLNPWYIEAMETVCGGKEAARKPCSEILASFGYTCDRIFSHRGLTGSLMLIDTQGFIAHNDTDVILAYRASDSLVQDWTTNLSMITAEYEPLEDQAQGHSGLFSCIEGRCMGSKPRVSKGFYDAFLASIKDIKEVLLPLLKAGAPRRVIVTGTSLGGGLADLAFPYIFRAADIPKSPHSLIAVTAGSPRVGDERYKAMMETSIAALRRLNKGYFARMVNAGDSIATMPPEVLGFYHHSKLCLLQNDDLFIGPQVKESLSVSVSGFDKHKITSYLAALKKIRANQLCS